MRTVLLCLILSLPAAGWARTLQVFAASSLTGAFAEMAAAFEEAHPGVEVALNVAGSSTLAMQILQGAPADVFASADEAQMQRAARAGLLAGPPVVFARNHLVIVATPRSGLHDPEDLARPGLLLVLAAPEVPAGHYARRALEGLGALYGPDFADRVLANLVSEEPNVRQVAAKVALGQADAALVYATDARAFPGLVRLPLPAGTSPVARYPIAVLAGSGAPDLAHAFREFVLSASGQEILRAYGFEPRP